MGHESQIELWSPNLTTFCFVGFGTDRLRRQEAMKTADRENPTHGVTWPRNRAHGAVGQNRTSSIEWAEKQEKFQPQEKRFFLSLKTSVQVFSFKAAVGSGSCKSSVDLRPQTLPT